MVKTIKQTVEFKSSPREMYELLMDSKKHSSFTGARAVISDKVGGKISAYDGWIEGENVKLIKNVEIVQKWRGSDWPNGVYSVVEFKLKKTPSGGTELNFVQTGVPDEFAEDIDNGWKDHYWDKIKKKIG
jgi:activator of HSP90 ATPase